MKCTKIVVVAVHAGSQRQAGQFKISIRQSPISPLGPLTTESGLYGWAFRVFFERPLLSPKLFLCSQSKNFLWPHFLARTVTIDRQMQNLDRLCNDCLWFWEKVETIVLMEGPLESALTTITLCFSEATTLFRRDGSSAKAATFVVNSIVYLW